MFGLYADKKSPSTAYLTNNWGLYVTTDEGKSWSPLFGLRANHLVFAQSPSKPEVLLLGITERAMGTLLRSNDGGKNWERIGALDVKMAIRDLAIDPQNPNWIYVLTDPQESFPNHLLLATHNGGASWADITPRVEIDSARISAPCRFLQTDPARPSYIAAGCSRTRGIAPATGISDLVESNDGGVTWNSLGFPGLSRSLQEHSTYNDNESNLWQYVEFSVASPQDVFAFNMAVGDHVNHRTGLVASHDGGMSWSDVSVRPSLHELIEPNSFAWSEQNAALLAFGSEAGTFVSRDGARTWLKALSYPTTAVAILGSGRILAGTRLGMFTSKDNGLSWHQSSFGLPVNLGVLNEERTNSLFRDFDNGAATATVRLEALEGNTIYVSARGGYWTSQDSGLTWAWHSVTNHLDSDSYPHSATDRVPIFHGPNIRQLLIAGDQTMLLNLHSENATEPSGIEILKVQPNGTITTIKTPVIPGYISISRADSNTLYLTSGDRLQLLKSDDAGFSWQTISLRPWLRAAVQNARLSIATIVLTPRTPEICYLIALAQIEDGGATTESTVILKTADGGKTWKDITPPLTPARPQDPTYNGGITGATPKLSTDNAGETLYLLLQAGLFHSSDGGSHWNKLSLDPLPLRDVAISPQAETTVYAGGTSGVWISKNAGQSWTKTQSGIVNDRIEKLLPGTGITLAEGFGGIYLLTDADAEPTLKKWQELELDVSGDPLGVRNFSSPVEPGSSGQAAATDPRSHAAPSSENGPSNLDAALQELSQKHSEEAKSLLTKTVTSGHAITLSAVEHKSLSNNEGVLSIEQGILIFTSHGKEIYRKLLAQVSVERTGLAAMAGPNAFYFDLSFDGKKHRFEYQPQGGNCAYGNGNHLICEGNGLDQQRVIAEWMREIVSSTH